MSPQNLYLPNYWISIGYQTGNVVVAENATNQFFWVRTNLTQGRAYAQAAVVPSGGQ